jgi:hypothetical protein
MLQELQIVAVNNHAMTDPFQKTFVNHVPVEEWKWPAGLAHSRRSYPIHQSGSTISALNLLLHVAVRRF